MNLKITQSQFAKNVMILLTGSLISQILPFLVLPILQTYFYSPADFGILAVFISLCELFSSIACLKIEFAIVVQRTIRKAINTAFAALKISWFIAFLSLIVVVIFRKELSEFYDEPKLYNYLFLIPIYVLFVGFNDVLAYWFNRKKKFIAISSSKIIQTSFAEGTKLSFGLLGFNFFGLILGRIVGFVFSACYFAIRFFKEDRRTLKLVTHKESSFQIKGNKRYIFFTTPSVFINSLINLAYLNLFVAYFGKEIVGVLGVSMTYLSAGFGVISVSFSQVFYSKIAEITDAEQLLKTYKKFAVRLCLIALIPLFIINIIPTSWVVAILGDEWSQLLVVARIMAIWLSIWFVSSSLSFIYIRLERQREMMIFDFGHLILILAGFFTARFIDSSLISALWGFTISQSIFYLFAIYIAIYFIKKSKFQ